MTDDNNQQPTTQPTWLPRPQPIDTDERSPLSPGRDDSWLRPQQMDPQEQELARLLRVRQSELEERARRQLERGNR